HPAPARPHARRAGAALAAGVPARRGRAGHRVRGLAPRPALAGHRLAVRAHLARNPPVRRRAPLSGSVPLRGDEPQRRPRHRLRLRGRGAPWLDAPAVAARLAARRPPGVVVTADAFTPDVDPYAGQRCEAVRIAVQDAARVRPVSLGIALLADIAA